MALPAVAPGRRRALTASATRVLRKDSDYIQRSGMPWQFRALSYYDSVPELHYAAQFYARMLTNVKLFPAILGDDLEHPTPIKTGLPVDLLNQVQDKGGGRTQILAQYGRLKFITGEGFLLSRMTDSGSESWSFVWRDEIRFSGREVTHVLAPGYPMVNYEMPPDNAYEAIDPSTAVAYRMWTPHPRFSGQADSPMRAVLDIAEELLILTKSVHATATSRLVKAGMLAIPSEIAPPPAEPVGDEDPLNDPFISDFTEHIAKQIQNPDAAEAVAPFVLWAAAEQIKEIRWINMHDSQSDYLERDLREEAVKRLGYGLDLPPEVLTGFATANHWTAWAIQDNLWNDHGKPQIKMFCNDLSEVFLRPLLEQAGYPDWDKVVIGYDATSVVVNPDRSDDANEAWDRGAISYAAYRRLKNIPEQDAQPVDEHAEWLETKIVKVREGNPAAGVPAELPATDQPAAGDQKGPPVGGSDTVAKRNGRAASAFTSAEEGAAQLALLRCRELAGIRLRRDAAKKPEAFERAQGMPNALVAVAIGHTNVAQLGVTELTNLTRGGADSFRTLLEKWGYSPAEAIALGEMVEVYAARTLFEEQLPALPAGFTAQLERTKGLL